MKKLLALFLLLLLLLSVSFVLTSCNEAPGPSVDSDSENQSESVSDTEPDDGSAPNTEVHNIIKDGVTNYAVIRPENAPKTLLDPIEFLYQYLSYRSSEPVRYETDYTSEYLLTGSHDQEAYEIIVGNTIYEQSALLYEDLGFGEYKITTIGNKIFVVAYNELGMSIAINTLINFFDSNYDDNTQSLSVKAEDIEARVTFSSVFGSLPAVGASNYDYKYDCGDSSDMLTYNNFTEDMFGEYITKLKEAGCKEHTSTTLNNNKFITLTSDSKIFNLSFTPSDSKMRVIIDDAKKFSLPEYDSDWDSSKKVCDSLLIQIGTAPEDNGSQNGQSNLIRCEDGRFIVYDGGHGSNESGVTPRSGWRQIYETIKKYTPPDCEPRIAAWIFTHAHGDHVAAFATYANTYGDEIPVEQFIYNFPTTDKTWNQYGSASTGGVISGMKKFADAEKVKAHPGQKFKFANVELEILCSTEFYAPKVLTNYNCSSIISRLFICGQSVLMPGDMSSGTRPICEQYYGNYLKSDFYQVTHHGGSGGSNDFNKIVAPTWVLWPAGKGRYDELTASYRNSWLSDPESSVKQIFPGWYQTTVITMPFDGTNYTVTPNTVYN